VNEPNRRNFNAGAAPIAAAAAVPLPIAEAAEMAEEVYGPPKYSISWWDKVELGRFAVAFAGLSDGRFDAVVDA
jgi:hypothetical protein